MTTTGRPIVITPRTVEIGADEGKARGQEAARQLFLMVLSGLIVNYLSKRL